MFFKRSICFLVLSILCTPILQATKCSEIAKGTSFEFRWNQIKKDLDSFVIQRLDPNEAALDHQAYKITMISETSGVLILSNKNFPTSELMLCDFLQKRKMDFEVLEFFGVMAFHIKRL